MMSFLAREVDRVANCLRPQVSAVTQGRLGFHYLLDREAFSLGSHWGIFSNAGFYLERT